MPGFRNNGAIIIYQCKNYYLSFFDASNDNPPKGIGILSGRGNAGTALIHFDSPRKTDFVCGTIRLKLRTKTSMDGIPSWATAARRPLQPHESLARRLTAPAVHW